MLAPARLTSGLAKTNHVHRSAITSTVAVRTALLVSIIGTHEAMAPLAGAVVLQ